MVGNYLHSYFESPEAHQAFIDEHKTDIISKTGRTKGQPKAPYKQADKMINCFKNDPGFVKLYQGTKETIVKGKIFGVMWKGKIDCLNLNRHCFIDIKTTQNIHKAYWSNEARNRESFIAHWNYQLQMWVYQQLIRQTFGVICTPYIAAVTKQDVPDHDVISIPQYRLDEARDQVSMNQEHIEAVKNGQVKPARCGECEYCRLTKRIGSIPSMDDLVD